MSTVNIKKELPICFEAYRGTTYIHIELSKSTWNEDVGAIAKAIESLFECTKKALYVYVDSFDKMELYVGEAMKALGAKAIKVDNRFSCYMLERIK